jgi:4-amino-4-deoxy-L-arabinose transferase-like glycosyltransferase
MNTDGHRCDDSSREDPCNHGKSRWGVNARVVASRYLCPSVSICGLILLCCALRGCALLLLAGGLRAGNDPDGYWRLAENLVAHGTFGEGDVPTAYRPPLYPLLLTGCVACGDYGRAAVGVLHVLLGVATVGIVFALGRRWGLGRRGAAVAALLVACDPILLTWSAQVMTETLAAFLTAAGLLILTIAGSQRLPENRNESAHIPGAVGSRLLSSSLFCSNVVGQALAGIVLGMAALCRPALLLWALAAVAVLWWQSFAKGVRVSKTDSRRPTAAGRIASVLCVPWAFCLGVILVLTPWAIRNQIQFSRPILTTTHGGYTLLLANNPAFYDWLRTGALGSVWQADQFNADWDARRPAYELQADRQAYTEALETIRRDPGTFFHACLVRIGRFWSPLPHQLTTDETPLRRLSRYAVGLWYVAEFALALLGLWRLALQRGEGRGERGEKEARARGESPDAQDALTPTLSQSERGEGLPAALALPPSAVPLSSSPWLWGFLLVVCLLASHAVYWTDMRMRAPVMPVVAMVAAAGLAIRRESEGLLLENGVRF